MTSDYDAGAACVERAWSIANPGENRGNARANREHGDTGAEQAGWGAIRASGIPTGGWMPRGILTGEGPRPDLAGL